jgi:hypothetical protein
VSKLLFFLGALFAVGCSLTAAAVSSAGQSRPVITQPVDDDARVIIPDSHPSPLGARDLGAVAGSASIDRLILVLDMGPAQQHQLVALLDSQQTKGSSNYHQWLTPGQFGRQFGPAPDDLAAVAAWLSAKGFVLSKTAASGLWIEFSGTASQVKATFRTEIHNYQLGGRLYMANASDVSVPSALRPVVHGVLSIDNYHRRRPMFVSGFAARRAADGSFQPIGPQAIFPVQGGGSINALAPGDFAAIYDLNPLYQGKIGSGALNGNGQTIAIVSRSDILPDDISEFRSVFGLPANQPTVINNGPDVPFNADNSDAVEATLDTEWAGAVAPGAAITLVVSGSTAATDGTDLSAAYIVDQDLAPVVSVSFGECEQDLGATENQFYSNLWQQAAAEGISVFVATGDSGAAACDPAGSPGTVVIGTGASGGLAVSGLASTPYDTAVGGTEFNEDGAGESPSPGTSNSTFWGTKNGADDVSVLGYIPEQVWNESCATPPFAQPGSLCYIPGIALEGIYVLLGGGGGLSTIYSPPSWQTLNVTGLLGSSFANRALPDVSMSASVAHDPYVVCFNSGCDANADPTFLLVGGTSAPTPSFAGIMAIVNQAAGSPQGLANYVLYPLAAQENFTGCNSNAQIDPSKSTTCVFHDTTVGNNGVPGNDISNDPTSGALGYPAATGYDPATGLGSVDAANLVSNWLAAQKNFQGTTTTLNGPGASITGTHGTPVTLTTDVDPDAGTTPPTGTVGLVAEGGTLGHRMGVGSGTLTPGSGGATFTGSFGGLPGGSYNLLAQYPGDGTFAASSSSPIPVNITPENSVASLVVSAFFPGDSGSGTPNVQGSYGTTVQIDAAVAGISGQGIPTGQITLADNGKVLAQSSLASLGKAEWQDCLIPHVVWFTNDTLSCFLPGVHNLTVSYGGDASFNPSPLPPSASQSVTLTIAKGTPFVALSTNPEPPIVINQPFALSAEVGPSFGSGAQPTGTVQFFAGKTSLGHGTVGTVNGITEASIQAMLPQGVDTVTGVYSGDSLWAQTTSSGTVQVGVPFGFKVGSLSQTVTAGQTATYNIILVASQGFAAPVSLACKPSGNTMINAAGCTVTPSVNLTAKNPSAPVSVTITTPTEISVLPHRFPQPPARFPNAPLRRPRFYLTSLFLPLTCTLCLLFLLSGSLRRSRPRAFVLMASLVSAALLLTHCGGGGTPSTPITPPPSPITASFQLTASAPTGPNTGINEFITLNLTVNP